MGTGRPASKANYVKIISVRNVSKFLPSLRDLYHRLQILRGTDILEEGARANLSPQLLSLLHTTSSPGINNATISNQQNGCELIEKFTQFLEIKMKELEGNFQNIFNDENYQSQLKQWQIVLSEHALKIRAEDILEEKLDKSSDQATKFFLKASMNILGSNLLSGFITLDSRKSFEELMPRKRLEKLEPLAQYIQALPQAELIKIIKNNHPDFSFIDELAYLIAERDDLIEILQNLQGCTHPDKQKEREEIVKNSSDNIPAWFYDRQRAVFIAKLLKKVDLDAMSVKKLIQLGKELYTIASNSNANKNYPEGYADSFKSSDQEIKNTLKELPKEIYQSILLSVINKPQLVPATRIEALRDLSKFKQRRSSNIIQSVTQILGPSPKEQTEHRELVNDTCLNILENSANPQKSPAGLILDACLILAANDKQQEIIDAISKEANQNDGKSLILFILMFTRQMDNQNHKRNAFIERLLSTIPNLLSMIEASRTEYAESYRGTFPTIAHLYPIETGLYNSAACDSKYSIESSLNLNSLIKLLMNTGNEILQANIVSILEQLDDNDLQNLIEEAEEDPNIKNFFNTLDIYFQ